MSIQERKKWKDRIVAAVEKHKQGDGREIEWLAMLLERQASEGSGESLGVPMAGSRRRP